MSKWNIECLNEEQVFKKQGFGINLVIPPSSVEEGQEVTMEVNIVGPKESEIILFSNVELVSCFYKIGTTGKFSRPIELHLQHNVEIRSQKESQQLAFMTAKEPPPYKFELLPISIACVIKKGSFPCQQMRLSYIIKVFFKHIEESS